jgi:hypothetical protein
MGLLGGQPFQVLTVERVRLEQVARRLGKAPEQAPRDSAPTRAGVEDSRDAPAAQQVRHDGERIVEADEVARGAEERASHQGSKDLGHEGFRHGRGEGEHRSVRRTAPQRADASSAASRSGTVGDMMSRSAPGEHGRLSTFFVAGWRGRVHSDWRFLVEDDPMPRLSSRPAEIVGQRHSAQTTRVMTERGEVYVKHLTAAKDRAGAIARLKWRFGPSRAAHVLRVSGVMRSCGLDAPPVVLAARRRAGGLVEELLVTRGVPGATLERRLLDAADAAERRVLLELAGRSVAQLHARRFVHGDLLPGNLIVGTDEQTLTYLDNDRTRRWPIPLPSAPRRRNLRQALYRLLYWQGRRETRVFLDAYHAARGIGPAARRRERLALLRAVHPRLRRAYERYGHRSAAAE